MPEFYNHLRSGVTRAAMVNYRLRDGGHVHTTKITGDDEYCAGGDSECPLFTLQLKEALESWTE